MNVVSMTPCHHFQIRVLNSVSSLNRELRAKIYLHVIKREKNTIQSVKGANYQVSGI